MWFLIPQARFHCLNKAWCGTRSGCVTPVPSHSFWERFALPAPAPAPPLSPPPPASGSVSLAPGQETTVEVTVDLDGLPPGPLRKMVSVYPAAPAGGGTPASNPVAVLTMEGAIAPAVAVTPPLLNFGPVTAGQSQTLLLTADIDARLFPNGAAGGGVGDVQLAPVEAALVSVTPVPASEGDRSSGQAPPPPAPGTVRRQFRVAVDARAPLGSLMTKLRFVPPTGTGASRMAAWHSGTTPVVALVLGDVSATPTRVDFGRVGRIIANVNAAAPSPKALDASAMQQVVLTSANERAFDGMECVSGSPFVQVQVQTGGSPTAAPPTAQPAVARRVLTIRLLPSAPVGAFSVQVTFACGTGNVSCFPFRVLSRRRQPRPRAKQSNRNRIKTKRRLTKWESCFLNWWMRQRMPA